MSNHKPFDPGKIDDSLTRVVEHNGKIYLLFPYIDASGAEPRFTSVAMLIKGPTAMEPDFKHLTGLIRQAGEHGEWFMTFATPWLLSKAHAQAEIKDRVRKTNR